MTSPEIQRRAVIFLFLLSGVSLGAYLLASQFIYRVGFPLDDAWIHQVYARNMARHGQWAFVLGSPSAGSTAPLWSAVLAVSYLVGLEPRFWAFLLGWIALAIVAVVGYVGFQAYLPGRPRWAWVAAGVLALEWHLVWAAASGMETSSFSILVTILLIGIACGYQNWLALGMLVGLSAWLRPDGITLLGPLAFAGLLASTTVRSRIVVVLKVGFGFAVLFIPYLVFNRALAGDWWPNTFYAKQAEYQVLRQAPFVLRYLQQLGLPLVGIGALLVPGFILFTWRAWKRRKWSHLLGVIWWLGYLGIYAWRLPVTYQHGRYLIPAIPIFLLWGLAGMAAWLQPGTSVSWRRILGRVWMVSTGLILLTFWVLGARSYGLDVAFIESEMVDVARWIAASTDEADLIAVHDIGAVGYFAERSIVDLAGLVSPEVIPFIRDESRLAGYLDTRNATYLVTFPGWYKDLISSAEMVYQTQGEYGPENMAVYRWTKP